jgi:hypothetical protein
VSELGTLRVGLNCALRNAIEFDRAFGNVVRELLQFPGDFVDKFVQADEVWFVGTVGISLYSLFTGKSNLG